MNEMEVESGGLRLNKPSNARSENTHVLIFWPPPQLKPSYSLIVRNRVASEEWRGLGTRDAPTRNVFNVGIASF